ncbi:pilus assembly protein PilP [Yersinia hibernica]|uniref:Pilus assembly protein PilP n=1 Tax=Yersinia enterocolitica LC20 TaxID=1443113 RepID=A0A7U4JZK1_YEREN|nr:pilus assembly protein PilP [Yersinia hibernica]AHM71530.1 pilus assembly protein PilP [Yersinia hibernica]OVZ91978.1 pilus assembly protein PilP [Yersinia kristensenii]
MSNHRLRAWVIAGLLVAMTSAASAEPLLAAIERNPFQQISTQSCDDDRRELTHWQLQGTVRGTDYHSGWVLRSEGEWRKLVIETRLLPHWRVTHISERQVSLQHVNSDRPCSGLLGTVVLSMR